MLGRFVPDRAKAVVAEERDWLSRLQRALARFDADPASEATLARSIAQLDRLFLLVIIGEFNAGKSAFVNALVGARLLEEGPTPTTSRLQILRYAETPGRHIEQASVDVVAAPVALLRDLDIFPHTRHVDLNVFIQFRIQRRLNPILSGNTNTHS